MTLSDYKKTIETLKTQLTATVLKDVSHWFIKGEHLPIFEDELSPCKRKEAEIEKIKSQINSNLRNAGQLALYGPEDNLGMGELYGSENHLCEMIKHFDQFTEGGLCAIANKLGVSWDHLNMIEVCCDYSEYSEKDLISTFPEHAFNLNEAVPAYEKMNKKMIDNAVINIGHDLWLLGEFEHNGDPHFIVCWEGYTKPTQRKGVFIRSGE